MKNRHAYFRSGLVMTTRRDFLKTVGLGAASLLLPGCTHGLKSSGKDRRKLPNIVFIMADDLGYGDVTCLNSDSKIPTPNLDRLASEGMRFTDAHSGSAVCTPTRYGVLTGRYCWRTRLKQGVLWGYSEPLVEPERMTVASLLRRHGYRTACVGKWHLGLGWATIDGQKPNRNNVDYTKPIKAGPAALGFDYFFGIPASLDMDPYVYIENDRVTAPAREIIEGHGWPEFYRGGPAAPGFKHEEVMPTLTEKAVEFIEKHQSQSPGRPFFLYFPLTAPHTPILPTEQFRGRSKAGKYGDFVVQVDWMAGQVMNALAKNGVADNTLIIFTSDNGPEKGMEQRIEEYAHHSSYHFRGKKRDIWDGGHRIPFIVRWPARIRANTVSDQTICLTDLMATAAEIVGVKLAENAAEDSYSILPAMLDEYLTKPIREAVVHHSSTGEFAIRRDRWKLILCRGSGGNRYETGPNVIKQDDPPGQLYDMKDDYSEKKNLYNGRPEIVERLSDLLEKYKRQGYSRPPIR
ncbi:MAG TPA: sulfatase-like hydrolase/transferase [Sedimentisphaerales bacterium]|nr:sulfatase-like hydrolase/transferase [Sedimentisphaerales bacterium]